MSFYVRQPHNWLFALCFVLVAVACRLQYSGQESWNVGAEPAPQVSQQQRRVQNLDGIVSGAIGIQQERGDSVYVVVK